VCRDAASVDLMLHKVKEMMKELGKMMDDGTVTADVDIMALIVLMEKFEAWVNKKTDALKARAPLFPGRGNSNRGY
jgi:hypothetical protein